MIGTLTQGHELPVVAPAAILRGVGRIDFDELSASFFRFAGQLRKEGRPRGICNAFGQTMIMQHSLDLQIFHADHPKTVNNLPTLLMGEIVPFEGNPLMDSRNHLPMLAAFSCAFANAFCSLRKNLGFSIASALERVAKVLSPTSIPTGVEVSGSLSGSHSTEKETYHLPVEERCTVQVFTFPLIGR